MKDIIISQIDYNFFGGFSKNWVLVVDDHLEDNATTIAWGGIKVLWNKPVATVHIRNTRYTK